MYALVSGLLLAVAAGTGAPADRSADWLSPPSADMLARYYPDEAVDRSVSGRVVLQCMVGLEGRPKDCDVESEAPVGMGFSDAALRMAAKEFRFKPEIRAGQPVESQIRVPLQFYAPTFGSRAIVTRAVWTEAPSFEDIAAAWPVEAGDLPEGRSVLRCAVHSTGKLRNCTIAGQVPKGSPFGGAARQLVDKFQLSMAPDEARKYSAADIAISFHFFNPATPAGQGKRVLKPDWIRQIDPEKVVALYPETAAEKGVATGVGVADCLVRADGALTDCKVAREDPVGLDFGSSAVLAASVARLNPWTLDGRPVAGARIRLPIQFNLADPAAEGK